MQGIALYPASPPKLGVSQDYVGSMLLVSQLELPSRYKCAVGGIAAKLSQIAISNDTKPKSWLLRVHSSRKWLRNSSTCILQGKPHIRKFSAHNSGARNGCANFMGARDFWFFLLETPMSINFLVLGGLGFFGRGQEVPILCFMGEGIFLKSFLWSWNEIFQEIIPKKFYHVNLLGDPKPGCWHFYALVLFAFCALLHPVALFCAHAFTLICVRPCLEWPHWELQNLWMTNEPV